MNEENVQPEAVLSEDKDVSPEVKPEAKPEDKPEGEPQAQPLTEERVQQLIAEATARAVTEAKEAGRRELQSEQDRNINAESRARFAESTAKAYETSFKGLDEETQKDIELSRYREQDKYFQTTAQEETQRQQEATFYQRMNEGVLNYLDSMGIARDDKRIDWGTGSQDYIEARSRLDASVAKIMTENKKVDEEKLEQRFKDFEAKTRKDLNLDSVDTTAGGGSGDDSDADFKKGIGDGSLPLNKTNMARAKKLGIA